MDDPFQPIIFQQRKPTKTKSYKLYYIGIITFVSILLIIVLIYSLSQNIQYNFLKNKVIHYFNSGVFIPDYRNYNNEKKRRIQHVHSGLNVDPIEYTNYNPLTIWNGCGNVDNIKFHSIQAE